MPLKVEVHPDRETISKRLRAIRVWQLQLSLYLNGSLAPGETFVDVGANLGYFTVIAAEAVGRSGRVFAFEPEPDNFALLTRNLALNGFHHATCHKTAVSDREGLATLHRKPENKGAHSLVGEPGTGEDLSVPVTTLDTALRDAGPVHMVKIDVQGTDLNVLLGMQELIASQDRPPRILMEFSPASLQALDPDLERFRAVVERFGYRIHAFIANDGPSIVPPEIGLATLTALYRDFLKAGQDPEFDILLAP